MSLPQQAVPFSPTSRVANPQLPPPHPVDLQTPPNPSRLTLFLVLTQKPVSPSPPQSIGFVEAFPPPPQTHCPKRLTPPPCRCSYMSNQRSCLPICQTGHSSRRRRTPEGRSACPGPLLHCFCRSRGRNLPCLYVAIQKDPHKCVVLLS